MRFHVLVVMGVFLITGFLLSGCGLAGAPPTALTVVVSNGVYAPAALKAPIGKPIRLTLDNQDDVAHQLAIFDIALATRSNDAPAMAGMDHDMSGTDEAEAMPPVHVIAAAGSQETVEFTPTQAGQYSYVCAEPGHTESGLLTVVSQS